jgi:hypothetical protein
LLNASLDLVRFAGRRHFIYVNAKRRLIGHRIALVECRWILWDWACSDHGGSLVPTETPANLLSLGLSELTKRRALLLFTHELIVAQCLYAFPPFSFSFGRHAVLPPFVSSRRASS